MKKVISVLLALVLVILCVTPMISAKTVDEKISPEVRALIDSNTEGGLVVMITHHNPNYPTEGVPEQEAVTNNLAAQRELFAQIEAIGYFEVGTFSVGKVNVGLPYSSIEAVAALENVDYIDLPDDQYSDLPADQKMDKTTKNALNELSPDTKVNLILWLAYNEHAYIGMAEPGDNASHAEVDHYLTVMRTAKRDYITAKNEEFARVIEESCEVENVSHLNYMPMVFVTAKLSEVEKIAALREVWSVSFSEVVFVPIDNPQGLEEKLQNWLHMSPYDPELAEKGLQSAENAYQNYREVYSNGQWALVYAEIDIFDPEEYSEHICIGSRVISYWKGGAAMHPYGYFVYNAAEDTFHPIERFIYPEWRYDVDENGNSIKIIHDPVISLEDYPGFVEALNLCNIGSLRGDADGDGETTILDATVIQRNNVGLANTAFYADRADADGDDNVTVLDATRVQRTVAELCRIDGSAFVPEDAETQRPTEMQIG